MSTSTRQHRPPWWQLPWREIGSFTLGAYVLVWQTSFESSAQPILVGAGCALVGVVGTGAIQRAVKRAVEGA